MDKFSKEMLIEISLDLDMKNVIKFCAMNKRINSAVYENENFWMQKLLKDYPNYRELTEIRTSYKYTYRRVFFFYRSIHTGSQAILDHFSENHKDI